MVSLKCLFPIALVGGTVMQLQAAPVLIKNSQNLPPVPGVKVTPLTGGLERPWGMTWLPDGTLLITERPGRVRLFRAGKLLPQSIPGVPKVFAQGQGGLLDIAAHPQFAQNRWVYFTYAHGTIEGNHTRVARAQFDGQSFRQWQVIWQAAPLKPDTQHFGSRMVWLKDQTLLVSIGDGGNPPLRLNGQLIRQQAQNRRSHLGKIIRIMDDGKIPPNNPWVNRPDADPAVWSYGHRNIQGLALDPQTKTLWATEHGARGGDELNQVQGGNNYGWPTVSYSRDYFTGLPISLKKSRPGLKDPTIVWLDAIAPSGLAVYRGQVFKQWDGNLWAGGLASRQLYRVDLQRSVQQVIPIGERVRDVRQGPDGLLYVLTDETAGKLLRIEPN